MTIEEIVHGESQNVEFKMMIPKDSEKYTKSVVAFANTQGGKLIFDVDDKTRKTTGIDEDELFKMMDSISNAISDSCIPQIVPNIEPQTVDRKTVIVVTVTPGANRPYYLKSKGKDTGTYIRVAGTSRPANAFVLMTSDYFPFSKTQCAVFKGTERTVFLDKREFSGPIYEQIADATDFVLRNIRLGSVIDGLVRRESYELPVEAIREMIVNAHCHRNLADDSCVQVAIYDDRLEVSSPGGLYNGLTYEELMNGHSKIRNRAVANVLNKMGFVESWGTGVKRIFGAAESYGLPVPRFEVYDDMFRVNLFRNVFSIEEQISIGETSEKHRSKSGETSEKHRRNIGETSE